MANKICYLCSRQYAIGKVLDYPLCRKCKTEVKEYSRKTIRVYPYTIEQKIADRRKKFKRRDFLLGSLLLILGTVVFTLVACASYGGF